MSQFGHRQKAVNQASSAMQTFYCRAKNTRGLQNEKRKAEVMTTLD